MGVGATFERNFSETLATGVEALRQEGRKVTGQGPPCEPVAGMRRRGRNLAHRRSGQKRLSKARGRVLVGQLHKFRAECARGELQRCPEHHRAPSWHDL